MIVERELGPDDWREWRDIRLTALATDPDAFGSRYEDWADADEARWRARLAAVECTVLLESAGAPVGVVCVGAGDPPELISLWVSPGARGAGVGDAAIQAVLNRCGRRHPGRDVVLHVKIGNDAALSLYERHGFEVVGSNPEDASELRMVHRAGCDRATGSVCAVPR